MVSEENSTEEIKKEPSISSPEHRTAALDIQETEERDSDSYNLAIDRSTNELVFRNLSTGHTVRVEAKIEDDDEVPPKPLSPDEFRSILEKIDALGLTWTGDPSPQIKPKESIGAEVLLGNEFIKIKEEYPNLPRELGLVILRFFSGIPLPESAVGNEEDLEQKVAIAEELVITPAFRAEFFFKHAIKVPYLSDIDWEVVFKIKEKNIKGLPGVAYALLSLKFLDPSRSSKATQEGRSITVAVDEQLVTKLLSILEEVKTSLVYGRKAILAIAEQAASEGKN